MLHSVCDTCSARNLPYTNSDLQEKAQINMKAFAVVLAVCLAVACADDPLKDVPKDLIKTCLTENGFDAAQYPNGLRNVKVADNQEKNRDCYYACMMKKMNLMKPDGMLIEDNLKSKFNLNLETLQKALNTCKAQVKGNDSCKLAACLMANRGI